MAISNFIHLYWFFHVSVLYFLLEDWFFIFVFYRLIFFFHDDLFYLRAIYPKNIIFVIPKCQLYREQIEDLKLDDL